VVEAASWVCGLLLSYFQYTQQFPAPLFVALLFFVFSFLCVAVASGFVPAAISLGR